MQNKGAAALILLASVAMAGCGTEGTAPQQVADFGLTVFVRNETDRTIVVIADGFEVLRVEAGKRVRGQLVLVPTPPPNTIEVRSADGHVFGGFRSDSQGQFGVPGLVKNTRCGDVWVWLDHDISAEIAPMPLDRQEACG